MNLNHREYFRAKGKSVFERLYLSRSHPVIVEEKSFFTAQNFKKLTSIAIELAELLAPHLPDFAQGALSGGKKALKKAKYEFIKAEYILDTYRPFLNYNYVFKTENLRAHQVEEEEFRFLPGKISWSDYIVNIQEPGLRKWCYSQIEGRAVEEYRAERPCSISVRESSGGAVRGRSVSRV